MKTLFHFLACSSKFLVVSRGGPWRTRFVAASCVLEAMTPWLILVRSIIQITIVSILLVNVASMWSSCWSSLYKKKQATFVVIHHCRQAITTEPQRRILAFRKPCLQPFATPAIDHNYPKQVRIIILVAFRESIWNACSWVLLPSKKLRQLLRTCQ